MPVSHERQPRFCCRHTFHRFQNVPEACHLNAAGTPSQKCELKLKLRVVNPIRVRFPTCTRFTILHFIQMLCFPSLANDVNKGRFCNTINSTSCFGSHLNSKQLATADKGNSHSSSKSKQTGPQKLPRNQ